MGIEAYRVTSFEFKEHGSFSLRNKLIREWLETNVGLNEELSIWGKGLFELAVNDADRMLREIGSHIGKEIYNNIEKDIKEAKEKNEPYILYYIF